LLFVAEEERLLLLEKLLETLLLLLLLLLLPAGFPPVVEEEEDFFTVSPPGTVGLTIAAVLAPTEVPLALGGTEEVKVLVEAVTGATPLLPEDDEATTAGGGADTVVPLLGRLARLLLGI
jgi:hypothetical protein